MPLQANEFWFSFNFFRNFSSLAGTHFRNLTFFGAVGEPFQASPLFREGRLVGGPSLYQFQLPSIMIQAGNTLPRIHNRRLLCSSQSIQVSRRWMAAVGIPAHRPHQHLLVSLVGRPSVWNLGSLPRRTRCYHRRNLPRQSTQNQEEAFEPLLTFLLILKTAKVEITERHWPIRRLSCQKGSGRSNR